MKQIQNRYNIIALGLIVALLIGTMSSYFDFGFVSVFFSVFLPLLFLLNIFILIIGIWNKKYHYSIGFLTFLLCFSIPYRGLKKEFRKTSDSFSILSFNVREFNADNDINEENIPNKISNFINAKNADILCIQESSHKISKIILNYPYKFYGLVKNKTLLEIHSKHPILKTGFINFPNTINNAVYADIKIKNDTIRLYNIHLQSFGVELNSDKENNNRYAEFLKKINTGAFKQIEQAELVKNNSKSCNKKIIISGDFNSTPFSLPHRILKKGLNDSFICKGSGLGSTYSLFNYPLRLDCFFVDPRIEINSHENFNLSLSDHEPILMTFKFCNNNNNNGIN